MFPTLSLLFEMMSLAIFTISGLMLLLLIHQGSPGWRFAAGCMVFAALMFGCTKLLAGDPV